MIKEVDEDNDGKISFREFLLIFRKAANGELQAEGLSAIASSVDVTEVREGCELIALYAEGRLRELVLLCPEYKYLLKRDSTGMMPKMGGSNAC